MKGGGGICQGGGDRFRSHTNSPPQGVDRDFEIEVTDSKGNTEGRARTYGNIAFGTVASI